MHVSFEVRLRIVQDEWRLMQLRGNELRRGRRVLQPYGGGIKATEDDRRAFGLELDDLRLEAPPHWYQGLVDYFEYSTPSRLIDEARREFYEEACGPRGILTQAEFDVCEFTYMRREDIYGESVRYRTFGEPMLYLIGLVEVIVPKSVMKRLFASQGLKIEFVSTALLRTGGKTRLGSTVFPLYSYLI
jgi:hypothetical protein